MPRRRHPANNRFGDDLVAAEPGEVVDPLVTIDRESRDYAAGAAARAAGEPRDDKRGLNFVVGWDEGAVDPTQPG